MLAIQELEMKRKECRCDHFLLVGWLHWFVIASLLVRWSERFGIRRASVRDGCFETLYSCRIFGELNPCHGKTVD